MRSPFDVYTVEEKLYKPYQVLISSPQRRPRMLELGNKKTSWKNAGDSRKQWTIWKDFFEAEGFDHTSVDWNGLDGALKKDLREPLGLGTFEMVTNIGTSEHVCGDRDDDISGQHGVWRNIVEAMHVDSVLVSVTPQPERWAWHGVWYPYASFYESLAELNGLHIEHFEDYCYHGDETRRLFGVRMRKVTDVGPFVMPPEQYLHDNRAAWRQHGARGRVGG